MLRFSQYSAIIPLINLATIFMEIPREGQRWYNKNDRNDFVEIKHVDSGTSMVTVFDKVGTGYGRQRPMPISELQAKYTHS